MENARLPSDGEIQREVLALLSSAADPNILTFKQEASKIREHAEYLANVAEVNMSAKATQLPVFATVRLAVEKSLGLQEGSLNQDGSKSKIKDAVHSAMDKVEAERTAGGSSPVNATPAAEEITDLSESTEATEPQKNEAGQPPKNEKAVSDEGSSSPGKKAGKLKRQSVPDGREKKGATCKQKNGSGGARGSLDKSLVCVLSETKKARRQVSVKKWKGNIQVDIREHYCKDTGEFAPSFKGITLNPSQWQALRDAAETVDGALHEIK